MNLPKILSIENSEQRLGIIPAFGGSAAFWEVQRNTQWHPIWRPFSPTDGPRRIVANCVLLPWSNRLMGGGITVDEVFYPMESNRPNSDIPMHGTGWMHEWNVVSHTATTIELSIEAQNPLNYPWHYSARQLYSLDGSIMTMRLEITHLGAKRMPYGLGFHPYILRNKTGPDVRLQFSSTGYWEGDNGVPTRHSNELPEDWNFSEMRELDSGHIDHNFTGSDGRMAMQRPDIDLHIDWLTTEPANLDLAILFRPTHNEFFCYEPVTHVTDAFRHTGMPGLRMLEQGQSMVLEVRQTLSRIST